MISIKTGFYKLLLHKPDGNQTCMAISAPVNIPNEEKQMQKYTLVLKDRV
jgi:hypothetical protein